MWNLASLPFLILYLVSLVIIPVIITQKKSPEAALAWVMLAIFVPFIGPFLYLVFGTERIKNRKLEKLFSNEAIRERLREIEVHWAPGSKKRKGMHISRDLEDIISVCRELSLFDAVADNSIEIIIDAEKAYQRMEEAIQDAKHHVNLDYYIYRPDAVGRRFRDLLVHKASQGVTVNFLYDAIGSRQLGRSSDFIDSMTEAGVRVKDFLPLRTFIRPWYVNLRNHRKLLIIDNRTAFTGA